jgi:tetratricopeptide (TPR) repeat protein
MKSVKIFLAIVLFAVIVLGVAKYFKSGFVRDYTVNTDKRIEDIRTKIAGLEKENIKDTQTLNRLADQYTTLGTIYLEKRLWDQSIEYYEKGLKYGKDTAGAYYSIGLAYANRGSESDSRDDINKAEFYYKKAIDMQDNYYDAQNALAILLYFHKDEKTKAILIMEEVVGRNKKNYMARFTLGRFYYESNQVSRALSVYEELNSDLEKLPPSGIIEEFKKNCRDNIQRIMMETKKQKGG